MAAATENSVKDRESVYRDEDWRHRPFRIVDLSIAADADTYDSGLGGRIYNYAIKSPTGNNAIGVASLSDGTFTFDSGGAIANFQLLIWANV